ncbi:hypothetical protein V1511DRAFT_504384 [Dipodascopsis uninucleata]
MYYISDLPNETLLLIFSFLESHSFLNVSQVCSRWRKLCKIDDVLFKHMKQHICETQEELDLLAPENFLPEDLKHKITKHTYMEYLYRYLLRRKFVGLELVPRYHVNCQGQIRKHPHFECSTHSADGTRYIALFRNCDTLPVPLRTIHIYDLSRLPPIRTHTFIFTSDTHRKATKVVIANDLSCLAIAFKTGYVQIYKLDLDGSDQQKLKPTRSLVRSEVCSTYITSNYGRYRREPSTCEKIYERQSPSSIKSLDVSSGAELLVIGCKRLGGLQIVNLKSGEELDLPHYRLDLTVRLEDHDRALLLCGWNETIVMRGYSVEEWHQKESIWKYYENLIYVNESSYIALEDTKPLSDWRCFVGVKVFREDFENEGGRDLSDYESGHEPEINLEHRQDGIVSTIRSSLNPNNNTAAEPDEESISNVIRELRLDYGADDIDTDFNQEVEDDQDETVDENGVGKLLCLLPNNRKSYRFILSECSSRLLVTFKSTIQLVSLNGNFLSILTNRPSRENIERANDSDNVDYGNDQDNFYYSLISIREMQDRNVPLISRKFLVDLWDKSLVDIWFLKSSVIVVEYIDEIMVFELSSCIKSYLLLYVDITSDIVEF